MIIGSRLAETCRAAAVGEIEGFEDVEEHEARGRAGEVIVDGGGVVKEIVRGESTRNGGAIRVGGSSAGRAIEL